MGGILEYMNVRGKETRMRGLVTCRWTRILNRRTVQYLCCLCREDISVNV